jgi:outer membrane protein OmpA-like peptidoglycan-associated protein
MATRSKKGIVAALIAWVVVLLGIALAWRLLVAPFFTQSEKERQEQQQQALIESTSAAGSYRHTIELHADGFSGYAVLRSPELRNLLKNEGIRLEVVDDGADYPARVRALQGGQAQMAAFPINSYLQAGAGLGEFPATILFIIDETQGADAILAWEQGLENLQGLNNENARVIYTPDSPSEFLAEITVESFILPKLPENWRVKEEGSEKILRMLLNADPKAPRAYVMWEPQVSEALENPEIHVLLDSSKTKGYILDALVVEREFLKNRPEVVKTFAESYFRALFAITAENRMVELVRKDAGGPGRDLPEKFAENIANGIQWKNTTDNYAYFGLKNAGGSETLDDVIGKIAKVMAQTGLIPADPLNGKYGLIYFDKILDEMRVNGFHPGKTLDVIAGDLNLDEEQASTRQELRALSQSQWEDLNPVAAFQVEEIRFPRMSDKVTLQNQRKLEALASRLKDWPSYYITIIGQSQKSDMEDINKVAQDLALRRANAAADYLKQQGIPDERLRTQARLSEADDWSALNLVFEAGQIPY